MFHILVVEDSATMRALLASALEALDGGPKVTEAATGFDALRLLPREAFDLVITDVNMPDVNGLELISFMKRSPQLRHVPILVISTESSERDRERGLALGADAYLVKPFDPAELQRLAAGLLERGAGAE